MDVQNADCQCRRASEKVMNSFPNYKMPIEDNDGATYDIHFAALFSKKEDAIPIVFLHGWPGNANPIQPIRLY